MMKKLLVNTFLSLAVIFHIGMLWNLAAHFKWQTGFPPRWLPSVNGTPVPEHWQPGKGFTLFRERIDPRFEEKWQGVKKEHVRSKQLMAVPRRMTDNTGLDFLVRDANNADPGGDFFQLVRSGHDVRQGTSIYQNYPEDMDPVVRRLLDETTPFHPPNRYPPGFAFTVGRLLSYLKPWDAYLFWVILHELVLLFCIRLSGRLAGGNKTRFKIAAGMWLAFLPWYLELYMGQTTFILMAATFVLAAHLDDRAGGFHAGLWWAFSLITKPVTLLFAPILVQRQRLGMLFSGLAIGIGSAASYFSKRPDDGKLFLKWMSGEEMVMSLGNFSFQALLFRFHMSEAVPVYIAGALVLAGLYMTFRRRLTHSTRLIAIWVCIYFLAYTHVWEHHMVLFLPAVILLWLYSARTRYVVIWLLAALPSPFYFFNNHWNWTREILYLAYAALPVLILFIDQICCNPPRALDGD